MASLVMFLRNFRIEVRKVGTSARYVMRICRAGTTFSQHPAGCRKTTLQDPEHDPYVIPASNTRCPIGDADGNVAAW